MTVPVRMRAVCWADNTPLIEYGFPTIDFEDAPFVAAFEFDPDNPMIGKLALTKEPALALTWSDSLAAHAFWTRRHPAVPFRPDGQPNKPMTAMHVIIEDVP